MSYSFLFKIIVTYILYIALAVSIIYYLFPPVILSIVWFIGSLYITFRYLCLKCLVGMSLIIGHLKYS